MLAAAAAVAARCVPAQGLAVRSVSRWSPAAALLRWPVLRWVAVALLASGLAQRSLDGLDGVEPGIVAGEVTLLSDPAPALRGRPRRRALGRPAPRGARARASPPTRCGRASPGRWSRVRGTVRPVEPGQPWLVARHIGGELTVLRVDGWRAGRPRQPGRQRPAPHAGRRAPRRSTRVRGRSTRAWSSATTGSSRPTWPTPSGAPASPTCSPCRARTWPSRSALAGPLLRRLRLWPRLVRHPRRDRSVRRDDPLRAVGAPSVGDGRAGGDAGDAGRADLRGCASSASPSPALVLVDPLLVRSVGFQLSVCAAVAIVVLAPRLASVAPGPGGRSARPPA